MPRYPVLDNLKTGGKRYCPGTDRDVVEMEPATAEPLQRLGVIGQALPAPDGDDDPAKSEADVPQQNTLATVTPSPEGTGEQAPAADASAAGLAGNEPGEIAAKRNRRK
jgi:hypothetical protein